MKISKVYKNGNPFLDESDKILFYYMNLSKYATYR